MTDPYSHSVKFSMQQVELTLTLTNAFSSQFLISCTHHYNVVSKRDPCIYSQVTWANIIRTSKSCSDGTQVYTHFQLQTLASVAMVWPATLKSTLQLYK